MPRRKNKGPAKPRARGTVDLQSLGEALRMEKTLDQLLTGETIAEQNLHHLFFADYYEQLRPYLTGKDEEGALQTASRLNESFAAASFHPNCQPQQALEKLAREKTTPYQSFDLQTTYPGLLAGTGLPHGAGVKGELGIGFTFDYVTGLPYLPGSTVKGVLRSGFRLGGYEFVRELSDKLRDAPDGVMQALERDIFDRETGGDVFFDAYPVVDKDGPLLATDNLAPVPTDPDSPVPAADQRRIKAPNVLAFLRVRPGIQFRFVFHLTDFTAPAGEDGEAFSFTASEKKRLFQRLILELGIGAKTNVGYGRMVRPK